MKTRKKITIFVGILTVIAIAAFNMNLKDNSTPLSLLQLSNVEALANGEKLDPGPIPCVGKYARVDIGPVVDEGISGIRYQATCSGSGCAVCPGQ